MDYYSVKKSIQKFWILIVAMVIIGGGLSIGRSLIIPTIYTATSSVIVSTKIGSDLEETSNRQAYLASRFPQYVMSAKTVLTQMIVEGRLGKEVSLSDVAVTSDLNSMVITTTSTSTKPELAVKISNLLASEIAKMITTTQSTENNELASIYATSLQDASQTISAKNKNLPWNALMGSFIGLLIGLALILLRVILNNRVNGPIEVQRITSSPVIGDISFPTNETLTSSIMSEIVKSSQSNSIRALQANIEALNQPKNSCLVIAPLVKDEEVPMLAIELGFALSQSGKRVLIVDCDLENPMVDKYINFNFQGGLTDVLEGDINLNDAVFQTEERPLHVLSSGKISNNLSGIISSGVFRVFLSKTVLDYDYVFCVAPPILENSDAILLSRYSTGTLVVVTKEKTKQEKLRLALETLNLSGSHVVGIIFSSPKKS